jgi:hypothetical protein
VVNLRNFGQFEIIFPFVLVNCVFGSFHFLIQKSYIETFRKARENLLLGDYLSQFFSQICVVRFFSNRPASKN